MYLPKRHYAHYRQNGEVRSQAPGSHPHEEFKNRRSVHHHRRILRLQRIKNRTGVAADYRLVNAADYIHRRTAAMPATTLKTLSKNGLVTCILNAHFVSLQR